MGNPFRLSLLWGKGLLALLAAGVRACSRILHAGRRPLPCWVYHDLGVPWPSIVLTTLIRSALVCFKLALHLTFTHITPSKVVLCVTHLKPDQHDLGIRDPETLALG